MVGRFSRHITGVLAGALLVLALFPAPASAAGLATQLVFGQQPSTAVAGAAISPAVTVLVEDAVGNVVATDTSVVTLSIGYHVGFGTLSGTTSVNAVNGVATFSNLSINNPQTYTLIATDGTLTDAVSSQFTITGTGAVAPAFTSATSTTFTVGAAGSFSVTATGSPTPAISLYSGSLPSNVFFSPGTGTATLSGTPTATGTYYLTFAATNTAGTIYQSFTLTVGSGANLVFVTQPGGGQPGVAWTQQPVVTVRDNYGNLVTTPVTVTLAIGTNPGGGTLYCPTSGTSVTTSGGYAYFSGCYITAAGTGYTLVASSSGLTSATSTAFTIGSGATPVTLTDSIAPGVNRGTSGFGTASLVVPANSYVTVLVQTSPNLAGSLVQIWVESKTVGWHSLTLRRVASDGTVHYFARVNGWTAYWVKFPGNSTYAAAASHGRIATNPD